MPYWPVFLPIKFLGVYFLIAYLFYKKLLSSVIMLKEKLRGVFIFSESIILILFSC